MALFVLQAANDTAAQLTSVSSQVGSYLEILLALAGVLVLAYVTLRYGLPWLSGVRPNNSGPIQVVARYPLEARKTLYLVKTGSQVFLIGTSENKMEYLTTIAPENAAEMLESSQTEEVPRKDFRQVLGWMQKGGISNSRRQPGA
jgi:flagellar protein FliO/FliZ